MIELILESRKPRFSGVPQWDERAQGVLSMELTEALVSDAHDDVIEITFTGDEDEWREIAAVLKESDSDLATELGLRIREALRTAGH
jgi:hypothetical protein